MLHSLLSKIASLLVAPLLFTLGLAGHPVPVQSPNLGASNIIETPVALFSTSLASSITSSASSMTLASATTLDGTNLASSTYSFIIDEGTASQEFVKADCTSTACVRMVRGVSSLDGTSTVAALQFSHRRGASVKITDAPLLINLTRIVNGIGPLPNVLSYAASSTVASSTLQIPYAGWTYNNFVNTSETQTVNGTKTFSGVTTFASLPTIPLTPSASTDAASKGYVDTGVLAGCANATTSVKGCSQEATAAQILAGTQTGSTGADLFVNPSALLSSGVLTGGFSTTSVQNLATTTIPAANFPSGKVCRLSFHSPEFVGSASTTPTGAVYVAFNTSTSNNLSDTYFTKYLNAATAVAFTGSGYGRMTAGFVGAGFANDGVRNVQTDFQMVFNNVSSNNKIANFTFNRFSTTTTNVGGIFPTDNLTQGQIVYASTTVPITSIDIFTGGRVDQAAFATSTQINLECF